MMVAVRPVPENVMARDTSNRRPRHSMVMHEMARDAADDGSLDAAPRLDGRSGHKAGWHGQCEKKLGSAHL